MRERFCKFWRVSAKPLFSMMLVVSIGFWVWNLVFSYGRFLAPCLAIHTPACHFGVCADQTGLAFVVQDCGSEFAFAISSGRLPSISSSPHGFVRRALGFTLAVLPNPIDERCYIVSPHIGVMFPYWFLITFSGVGLFWVSGLLGPFVAGLSQSRGSMIAIAVVLLLFAILNVSSVCWKPPENSGLYGHLGLGRLALILFPESFPSQSLWYGFPFECYGTTFGRVDSNRGDTLGWKQEKVMENIVVALLVALVLGWTVKVWDARPLTPEPK